MSSDDFQAFVSSLNAPLDRRETVDSFDLGAVARLQGNERDQAEKILIDLLSREEDGRVAPALVVLGSSRAVPALESALARWTGAAKVTVAEALWQLTRDRAALDALVDAAKGGDKTGRVWAVGALKEIDDTAADDALLVALDDADEAVRLGAAESLFVKRGLEPYQHRQRGRLNMIRVRLQSGISSVRRAAIDDLRAILQAQSAGKTLEQQGFSTAPDAEVPEAQRFIDSYLGSGKDFDVDAVRALKGEEREFADYMLLYFADHGDPRAFRALAALRLESSRAALSELSQRSGPIGKLAGDTLAELNAN